MTAKRLRTKANRVVLFITAMTLVTSACGTSATSTDQAAETEVSTDSTSGETSADSQEEAGEESASSDDETVTTSEPPDLTGLRTITTNALGGLRLGTTPDVAVLHEGELVEIRHPNGSGKVIIARASLTNTGSGVTTVDQFLDAAKNFGPVAGEPTSDTINVLGMELEEYAFRADGDDGNPRLFPSSFRGMSSNKAWGPLPIADLYLGEAKGGVFAVGVVTDDDGALPELHRLLEEITPTLSLTGPALLPVPTTAPQPFTPLGEPDPVAPREVANALAQPFSLVEPGSYDLANLAIPTEVTLDDGWFVAPNFPGFVALADISAGLAAGPGDHAIAFIHGVTGIHSLGSLRGDVTEPISLQTPDEWNTFLTTSPPGLVVSDVDVEATVGGMPAIRFDIEVDPAATCQDASPCAFAFSPPNNNFVTFVRTGYINRFWWVADAPSGGLLISAHAPAANADWADKRAAELLSTVAFE